MMNNFVRLQKELLHLQADTDNDDAVIRDQVRFLRFLWSSSAVAGRTSFGALCFRRRGSTKFVETLSPTTRGGDFAALLCRYNRWEWDQYFGPNTFGGESRRKQNAQGTRLAWCDIDEADPHSFEPHPSMIWKTSPGRFQALWIWNRVYPPMKAEAFSRALTYRHGGDKNGWPVNKLLRLPGSINHKPSYREPLVQLLQYDKAPIMQRPKLLKNEPTKWERQLQTFNPTPFRHDRLRVLEKYRRKLNPFTRQLIRDRKVYAPDRSSRIFAMVAGLHEAGADYDEIASVVWGSVYFRDKYGENLPALQAELSRIVLKLEAGR